MGRVLTVDVFRGLTVLVMVFVNDAAGVKGLPWWTYHMPEGVNGMTYVDLVFSAFLFIVGISIPLAFGRRMAKGASRGALLGHVVARSLSLVAMGYVLANLDSVDAGLTGLSRRTWDLLAFAGILLAWMVYPKHGRAAPWCRLLRASGLILLAVLFAIFRRRTETGQAAWLDLSYPEILGLIGFAYLCAGVIYLALPKTLGWMAGAFAALNAMNAASKLGWLQLGHVPIYVWPLEDGALASIILGGIVFSMILFGGSGGVTLRGRMQRSLGLGALLLAAGVAALPLGISKNHATPSWCLFSEAACIAMIVGLYYLVDVRQVSGWAAIVKPAGSNTLLTYLLPWILSALPFFGFISAGGSRGAVGVLRACIFTIFVLMIAAVLTRMRVRMQL